MNAKTTSNGATATREACAALNTATDNLDAAFRGFCAAMAADKSGGASDAAIAKASHGRWAVSRPYVRAYLRLADLFSIADDLTPDDLVVASDGTVATFDRLVPFAHRVTADVWHTVLALAGDGDGIAAVARLVKSGASTKSAKSGGTGEGGKSGTDAPMLSADARVARIAADLTAMVNRGEVPGPEALAVLTVAMRKLATLVAQDRATAPAAA